MRHQKPRLVTACLVGLTILWGSTAPAEDVSPNWGFNFWTHDYFTGDAVFVDASKTFYYNTQDGSESLPRTDQGVPIGGQLFTMLKGYQAGTYQLRYEGSGDLSISGMGSQVKNRRVVNGVSYADIDIANIDGFLRMDVDNIDNTNPIRNIRLISPGYDVNTNQLVRDEFKQRVSPFSTVRFMDWNRTNSSVAESWDARRPADYLVQTVGFRDPLPMGGMAYEHMIDVANELGKDAWFNVPHRVDENYMRQMARTIRDRLDPDRKVIMEFSNELWNFRQGPELGQAVIHPDWSWQDTKGQTLYYGAVAPKVKQMSDIFHQELGGPASDRLEIVLAGQSENIWHVEKALEWFEDQGLDPRHYIDAISGAPYFSTAKIRNDYTDLDEMMNDMVNEGYRFPEEAIVKHKVLADEYDMKYYAYEGGQHVWFNNVGDNDLVKQAQQDPRMGEAYKKYMALWEQHNPGGLFMHYTLTGSEWGLLKDMNQDGSPKWDAVIEHLTQPVTPMPVDPSGNVILMRDGFDQQVQDVGGGGREGLANSQSGWSVNGVFTSESKSVGGEMHQVATSLRGTISRTIDTRGFRELSLELIAFQNPDIDFEVLEDLEQLGPNWSDYLRIRIDVGDGKGWQTLLLDDGAWSGEHNTQAAEKYFAEAGNGSPTSTGRLLLPESAWDIASLGIEIEVYSNRETEFFHLDEFVLRGTAIPEPTSGVLLSGLGLFAIRSRRFRKAGLRAAC
jgi:hypothetical protein